MLSFFSRCPNINGQVWESFYSLKDLTLPKIRAEQERGLTRGHTLEIINSLMNNPKEYFNYEAYEYACSKNDLYEAFNNLKKVMYLNEEPFDEEGSTLKYGEVSINRFPFYDEYKEIDCKEDFLRTLRFMLSKRAYIFYKYGFDWVLTILSSLEDNTFQSNRLKTMLKEENGSELLESLSYLLESKIELKPYLECLKDNKDWVYEVSQIC